MQRQKNRENVTANITKSIKIVAKYYAKSKSSDDEKPREKSRFIKKEHTKDFAREDTNPKSRCYTCGSEDHMANRCPFINKIMAIEKSEEFDSAQSEAEN